MVTDRVTTEGHETCEDSCAWDSDQDLRDLHIELLNALFFAREPNHDVFPPVQNAAGIPVSHLTRRAIRDHWGLSRTRTDEWFAHSTKVTREARQKTGPRSWNVLLKIDIALTEMLDRFVWGEEEPLRAPHEFCELQCCEDVRSEIRARIYASTGTTRAGAAAMGELIRNITPSLLRSDVLPPPFAEQIA